MSQKTVEHVIGKLATDEGLRLRFRQEPREAVETAAGTNGALTAVEMDALAAIDPGLLDRFADALDSRLQRVRIPGDGDDGRKP